jgi:phosphate transport system permease protein
MSQGTPSGGISVRQRVQEAGRRIRTLKRIDRGAAVAIVFGGLAVVASVLGILFFVGAEAWPLFRPPQGRLADTLRLQAPAVPPSPGAAPAPGTARPFVPLAAGVDEYQMYLYAVAPAGRGEMFRLADASWARGFPIPGLGGQPAVAASRSHQGDLVAAATSEGRVALAQVHFRPRYDGSKLADLEVEVADRGVVDLAAAGRPVRQVDYVEDASGGKRVALLLGRDQVAVWSTDESGAEVRSLVHVEPGEAITRLRLGERGASLVAGTERGRVYHWELGGEPRLTSISPVSGQPVTALDWALGSVSFIAGDAQGALSAWFPARLQEDDPEPSMVKAHTFAAQGSAVRAIGAGSRDKSFVTAGDDGSLTVRFLTNERTLLRLEGPVRSAPNIVLISPKNDGIVALYPDGRLARFTVAMPHPEVTLHALFGKVWYEGYGRPEYVWQSTGATNDFEAKFSLFPLVFGTLKGTLYALLFAIPLAVMGALYTSQFMHPEVRSKIKPTIEIMAALPSVVVGFIAGLWLAPLVERVVVPVLLMGILLPLFGTAGVVLWRALPTAIARRLKAGMELALIVPLLVLGGWLALQAGPWVERVAFHGDFKLWLSTALGLTYDQRNCLVVGLAMGFAVIPIIFTIADDAFSSVPSNLTAASLALGASRWQTALRVVLPTASPGVFSAIMIGFGRAVGETMIVLMATGNTPVLDWSVFNGMRTLSANIAVEIPEAPYGGTLYRVLFLAGALLFAMTFVVNTVAELIRQHLRERYRAL